jgi:serine/threonine protein kinase
MSESVLSGGLKAGEDQTLGDLLDAIVERIQSGQSVDLESWVREHPQHEARLRTLWPTVQTMTRLADEEMPTDETTLNAITGGRQDRCLGEFQIIREIGRGGMGVVYEAEQHTLGRRVALKVMPFAAILAPRQLERFKLEAKAAAMLHHTNIVPVYSVGSDRGVHYYAMQYIEGCSCAAVVQQLRHAHVEPPLAESASTWSMPTFTASSIAISSRPICCWISTAISGSPTLDWHAWKPMRASP